MLLPSSFLTRYGNIVVSYHNISADYFPQAKNVVYLILRDDPLRRFAPAPPKGEPLAWRESLRLNRKACGRACSPGGAVAQRLKGFKSAEPEKTVKRSSRRTGVNLQFFPVQPTSLGLKGASSPFSWLQRVEIAGTFLVLFWCQKRTSLGKTLFPIVDRSIYRRYPRHAAHRKIL